MKRWMLAVMVAVLAVSTAGATGADRSKSMEPASVKFDRDAHFQRMAELHDRLADERVTLAEQSPLVVEMPGESRRDIAGSVAVERKMRVGSVQPLSIDVALAPDRIAPGRAALHDQFGAFRVNADRSLDWTGIVQAPLATAGRVHFTGFDLPPGAEMYVYSRDGLAFGPYTLKGPNGTGEFWTNTIAGSELILQLHSDEGRPRFTISGFGHLDENFAIAKDLNPRASTTKPCAFNADCVLDAACVSTNAAVNTARDAVAHMLFASGAYLYICSGGLVADSDSSSNIPYFVTANHCISSSGEASSLETFFFYRATSCGSCQDPGAASTTGATLVSSNRTSDYTLLRLSQPAPAGAAFLGWSSTAIANSNNTPLFRLSHPGGAPQAYSEHVVDTSKGTCRSWPRGNWIYSRDIKGATEGGSSGSPVVNAQGQLVGQLSGGCGYNVQDECDSASNATVDGAFAAYYTSVASVLGAGGGGGGCTDADGDGVCASAGDCNDNNPAIYPGANDTKGRAGRDGIDNDCDGVADR